MAKKMNLGEVINKNLPGIFTTLSIITGIGTAVGGVVAGYKLSKKLGELPEDAETLDKAKVIIKYTGPVAIGAIASSGFAFAAHKESAKRIVLATGTIAALKTDKEHLEVVKDKAREMLGEKKTEELNEKVASEEAKVVETKLGTQPDQRIKVHDLETGYEFETTLRHFLATVNRANDVAEANAVSMKRFYTMLLDDDYQPATLHNVIGFGYGCGTTNFRPEFGTELGDNLEQIYTIEYEHSNLEADPQVYNDPWRSY